MVNRSLSIEDGNLNSPTLVTSRKVDYKDIDLSFTAKLSGDIYKKIDAAAVKQAVKNLLLTGQGEKPFQPLFGAGLGKLLFDLIDTDSEEEIRDEIRVAIKNYEPRINVLNLIVKPLEDYNSIEVTIVFQIISTEEVVTFKTSLARIR